tara:strand:- start:22462 stop:24090 length:1629 start_codon:yes stop_codon:yes gene_type:complete
MIQPTPHPYYRLPTQSEAAEMGPEKLSELLAKREELILQSAKDPFHNGIEPPHWKMADDEFSQVDELLVLGGNRSGKSTWASKRVVKCINDIPEANVLCMHTTASTSVEQQQQLIWDFIPSEWKAAKKGKVTNMTFSKKGGFTESCCVAPNGSRIFFRNYSQNLDSGILEGSEWDLVWMDELCGLDHVQALRFRLVTRAKRPAPNYPEGYPWRGMMITFTPVTGYTPTVREYLQGATTEKWDWADPDLLVKEKVPIIQQPLKENAKIIYFWSEWNKFNDYKQLKRTLQADPKTKILMRAFGLPTRVQSGQFPRFSQDHLVSDDQIPEEGTNYMICDPSHGKNWVMIWVRVAKDGKCYVYREFPSQVEPVKGFGFLGEWAVSGKKIDGDKGPAQDPLGFSLVRYKETIEEAENGEEIFLRIMDSRFGASPTPTKSGMTTLIDQMADLGMFFEPSIGARIEEGVTLINDLLDWNEEEEMTAINCPRLYVHENCKNLRFSLATWTGNDGRHGSSKDFIDTLRYFCLSGPTFLDPNSAILDSGGTY